MVHGRWFAVLEYYTLFIHGHMNYEQWTINNLQLIIKNLPRRPIQFSSTQYMQVQMRYFLSAITPIIYNNPISAFFYA